MIGPPGSLFLKECATRVSILCQFHVQDKLLKSVGCSFIDGITGLVTLEFQLSRKSLVISIFLVIMSPIKVQFVILANKPKVTNYRIQSPLVFLSHQLELVYSDIWGPALESIGRYKYYVSFIDDFSKFT
jgi:hypothetical protein